MHQRGTSRYYFTPCYVTLAPATHFKKSFHLFGHCIKPLNRNPSTGPPQKCTHEGLQTIAMLYIVPSLGRDWFTAPSCASLPVRLSVLVKSISQTAQPGYKDPILVPWVSSDQSPLTTAHLLIDTLTKSFDRRSHPIPAASTQPRAKTDRYIITC